MVAYSYKYLTSKPCFPRHIHYQSITVFNKYTRVIFEKKEKKKVFTTSINILNKFWFRKNRRILFI